MADEVYIPICADAYSLQGIKATEELIDNVSDFNVKLKIGGNFFVLRWEGKKANKTIYEMVQMQYPDLLIPIKIGKSKYCEENTMFRVPLWKLITVKIKVRLHWHILN